MKLTGKQKRYLRSQAHHLSPIFQIGKGGLSPELNIQIEEAIEKREILKVSLLQNTDVTLEEAQEAIEAGTGAVVVQMIGHMLVLYKPSSKEKYQTHSSMVNRLG